MDKFLEICNVLRINHEETESLNRPMTNKEIELVIENIPEVQDQMTSPVNATTRFKRNTNLICS